MCVLLLSLLLFAKNISDCVWKKKLIKNVAYLNEVYSVHVAAFEYNNNVEKTTVHAIHSRIKWTSQKLLFIATLSADTIFSSYIHRQISCYKFHFRENFSLTSSFHIFFPFASLHRKKKRISFCNCYFCDSNGISVIWITVGIYQIKYKLLPRFRFVAYSFSSLPHKCKSNGFSFEIKFGKGKWQSKLTKRFPFTVW